MHLPSSIVITGMGFVTPLGCDRSEVVTALRQGLSGITDHRLDWDFALLMARVKWPGEDHGSDLSGSFALASTREAWKESGLDQHSPDPWRTATLIGVSKIRIANLKYDKTRQTLSFNPENLLGNTLGLEVARAMDFRGPILNYPAACATGIHCLIRAAQCLQNYEADVAVAGCGEFSSNTLILAGFRNMGALSPERTRPFDKDRKGFNPGEGAASFVLEREEDAVARGATILARISGWDQRSDAHHITSAETSGETVSYAIRRTLAMAGWETADVEYINAHGTGTKLNDLVEGRSIHRVFGADCPPVSSLKPNIGHLLGASSAVEIAVAMACLRDGYIPPTLGLTNLDPDISLQFVSPLGCNKFVRRFIKLSLGFGGHIGVLAVELT